MSFKMQPAQFPAGGWPEGTDRTPGADQTYPAGVPVTWDEATSELDAHAGGATVTGILGVTLEGVVAGNADNPSGTVNYAKANRTNVFAAQLINGSGVVQIVDAANMGVRYGILKVGTGSTQWWGVDEADTTDVVVEVVDIDTHRNIVFFKFLESAIEEN